MTDKNCPLIETCRNKDDLGEILFFNNGDGYGFAICPQCRRADNEEEFDLNHKIPQPDLFKGGHKSILENKRCQIDAQSIKRNVVLTSRLQTSYTVIAFKNTDGIYVTDKDTVLLSRSFNKKGLVSHFKF